jgi:hypothetical protein
MAVELERLEWQGTEMADEVLLLVGRNDRRLTLEPGR